MKKVSKILVMAVVILAVIAMSLSVNAAEAKNILTEYIRSPHNVNGMLFELTNAQKNSITDYITTLSDETAASIHADLVSMENTIRSTGATRTSQINNEVRTQILNQAKATANKAGLTLTVNTGARTFTLSKADGSTLASGKYTALATNPGTAPAGGSASGSTARTTATGAKLLYTGANYAIFALPVLAIIAVAVVVKKRA